MLAVQVERCSSSTQGTAFWAMVVPLVSPTDLRATTRGPWLQRALLIGGGALVVRLAYWFAYLRHYVPQTDAAQYVRIAHNFAIGHGIADYYPQVQDHLRVHATAFRPPLYPALLGALFKLFGTHLAVAQAANAVLGAIVVVLADIVATRIAGPRAGLAASGIVALTPSLLANDLVPLSEPLSLVLFLLVLLLLIERRWVTAGFATGLLLLTRPSGPALLLAAGGWLVWKAGWKATLRFAATAMVTVAPWVVRNQIHMHAPVLITSNGFNVNAVYSSEALADGGFVDASIDPRFGWLRPVVDEPKWDQALLRHGLHGAVAHPASVVHVVALNVVHIAELLPGANRGPEQLDGRNLTFRVWTLPVFYLTTALGVLGLWRHRSNRLAVLLVVLAAVLVVPSILTVAVPRLRAPLDLALAIGAALCFLPVSPVTANGEAKGQDDPAEAALGGP
jgi:4-amino-4-deoxy-L-arabinose transferase-like glycosyltransferase